MGKIKVFSLNFSILSILLSFHLVNISQGLLTGNPSITAFMISLPFLLALTGLTAVFIILLNLLIRANKIKPDKKQDKIFLTGLVILLVLDIALSFQRTAARIGFGLYNLVLISTIGLVYYRLNSFKNGISKPDEKRLFKVILVTAGILAVFFGIFNGSLHNAFFTSSDMGIFTNAIWRINHDGTQNTFIEQYKDHTGVHMQPVLYLLAPLFRLHCSPYILIFLQVIFVFFAAAFLYLLAQKITGNKAVSYLMALSFLVSTYTFRTISYDYHPETMYMMMFFAFLYFAEAKNFVLSAVFMCLAVMMKEEAPVYMAAAAVFAFLRTKDRRYIVLSVCSAIYAYVAIKIIMPAYNSSNSNWLELLMQNFSEFELNYVKTNFLLQFFIFLASAAFLPLFELRSFLLIFLPAVCLHLIRFDRGFQFLFDLHYAAFVVPPLFCGAIYALDKIAREKKIAQQHVVLAVFVVFLIQAQIHLSYIFKFSTGYVAVVFLIVMSLLFMAFAAGREKAKMNLTVLAALVLVVAYAGFYNFYREKQTYVNTKDKESIYRAIAHLPEDENTAVITNINIVPHLCCRKYVWQQEWGSSASVLLPVIKEKLKEFYMLVYLYDYSYTQEKLLPAERNREINDLAVKMGYKYEAVYGNSVAAVFKYSKE